MICQPAATRKANAATDPAAPGSTPPVAHWPAGQREQMGPPPIRGHRRQPPHTATVRGGCPQGAIAAGGSRWRCLCARVLAVRRSRPAPPTRLARAGPGRDGQVHPAVPGPHRYLRRHPGVVSRQTEYDAAVTRALLEACVSTCKSCGEECERHSRQRAFGR